MGAIMIEDDIYIPSLLELFNLRFAPTPAMPGLKNEAVYGGIDEVIKLQEEFAIFRRGRPFSESAALLGLGGIYKAQTKNRWFDLLRRLPDGGDQKIADALLANFKRKPVLPCFMRAHDLREKGENRVIFIEPSRPIFYIEQEYLTISLPMAPRRSAAKKRATKK